MTIELSANERIIVNSIRLFRNNPTLLYKNRSSGIQLVAVMLLLVIAKQPKNTRRKKGIF